MNPYPLDDETYGCFVARLRALGPLAPDADTRLTGECYLYLGSAICHLNSYVDEYLRELGISERAIYRLGYASLLRAFVPVSELTEFFSKHEFGRASYRNRLLRILESVTEWQRYCPTCIDNELSKYGFWYSHRMHSLCLLEICHKQLTTLVRRCPGCNFSLGHKFDIKPLSCRECGFVVRHENLSRLTDRNEKAQLRILAAIQSILSGTISGNLNTGRYCRELGIDKKRHLPTLCQSRRIVDHYGSEFLRRSYIHPYCKPRFARPSIYLNDAWPDVNPAMELLLAAMLPAGAYQRVWNQEPTRKTRPERNSVRHFDFAMMKLLLSGKSIEQISRVSGLSVWTVRCLRRAYLGLISRLPAVRNHRERRML